MIGQNQNLMFWYLPLPWWLLSIDCESKPGSGWPLLDLQWWPLSSSAIRNNHVFGCQLTKSPTYLQTPNWSRSPGLFVKQQPKPHLILMQRMASIIKGKVVRGLHSCRAYLPLKLTWLCKGYFLLTILPSWWLRITARLFFWLCFSQEWKSKQSII